MELGLNGRTAIVCGASSGMGLATADALAREGANVSMFARRRDLLDREAERLGALAVRGDVTNLADLKRLVDRTVTAFGGIDVLVNNSGGPPRGPAVGLTAEQGEDAGELLLVSVGRPAPPSPPPPRPRAPAPAVKTWRRPPAGSRSRTSRSRIRSAPPSSAGRSR